MLLTHFMDKDIESRLSKIQCVRLLPRSRLKDVRMLDREPIHAADLPENPFPLDPAHFRKIPFPRNNVRIPCGGEQDIALPITVEEYLAGSFPPMVVQNISVPGSWKQQFLTQFSKTPISTAEENSLSISLPYIINKNVLFHTFTYIQY